MAIKDITLENIKAAINISKFSDNRYFVSALRYLVEVDGVKYPIKGLLKEAHKQIDESEIIVTGSGNDYKKIIENLGLKFIDAFETFPEIVNILESDERFHEQFKITNTQKKYAWIGDLDNQIGNKEAHYELRIGSKGKYSIELHFENSEYNKAGIFESVFHNLDSNLFKIENWKYGDYKKIVVKNVIQIDEENLIEEIINQLILLNNKLSELVRSILSKANIMSKQKPDLNQILYGPPGTGKTYNTINKAISIIDSLKEESLLNNYKSRIELKERFDDLFIDDWENAIGQIGFVTFHQSMSYEDFIEGIKPVLTNENKVIYDVEPGIFKKMAEIARDNWLDSNKGKTENLSFEDAFQKLKDEWYDNPEMKFPLKREGNEYTILGFTKTSIKFKKASGGTGHTLSISTIRDYFYNKREVRSTGVGIYYPAILDKLKSYQPIVITKKEEKNYVLIIDEINRGNVSQIFGELITLIEDDKRLGKDEALEVILPYSKDKFGVPPNLYIIGTMNTADRSVEALDAALRRRFSFIEMPPKPELLSTKRRIWDIWWKNLDKEWFDPEYSELHVGLYNLLGVDTNYDADEKIWKMMLQEGKNENQIKYLNHLNPTGIDLKDLLIKINTRIEKLLDKDHQIGHSYFLSVYSITGLKEAFQNKIIPLLQEYFFGDYSKIGLVLGKGFIDMNNSKNIFADFDEELAVELSERPIYTIKNLLDMSDENFRTAIKLLIGTK